MAPDQSEEELTQSRSGRVGTLLLYFIYEL